MHGGARRARLRMHRPPRNFISFRTPRSWLYNLFVSSFKGSIKSSIVSALRSAVNPDAINKDLARLSEERQVTRSPSFTPPS